MHLKFLTLAGLVSLGAAQSLIEALNTTANLSSLYQLVASQPNLAASLSGLSNITVLAPNNDAIAEFTASGVVPTAEQIQAILQYHILQGENRNFSTNATFVPTYLNNTQYSNVSGGQRVEIQNTTAFSGLKTNSSIVSSPLNITGGVVHIVDRVLTIPQNISTTATAFNLTSFYGALNASGLLTTLSGLQNVTVFAPTNEAFSRIGSALPNLTNDQVVAILSYHVVSGTVAYSSLLTNNENVTTLQQGNVTVTIQNSTSVFVNDARVVIPDVLISNGVIHVIDEVLNPMNATTAGAGATGGAPAFSGASSVTEAPFTSGQPTPTSSINTGSIQSSATAASSSSSGAAWAPRPTGAIGAAALGGLALIMQL